MRQLIPWNGVQTSQIRHLQSSKVWLGIPCDAKAAFLDGHAGSSTSGNDDRHVQGFLLPKSWSRKSFLRDDSHHGHHVQCDHVCVCGHAPLMPFLYLKRTMHTILLRTRLPDVFELSVLSVFSPGQQPRTFDQIS